MANFFDKSLADSISELKTDVYAGLSSTEAAARLKANGENRLVGKKEKTFLQIFFSQFNDCLVYILIVAAVVSIAVALFENESILDGIIIMAIVILNAVLGMFQENKANNALKALKELSSPLTKVIRDGNMIKINSIDVVCGDVVIIDAGDYLPADLRLIETINLKIDESSLTGESVASEKDAGIVLPSDAPLGDRKNCGYMGSVCTYGRGKGIVSGTGMDTQMGKIADMLSDTKEESTPLQKKLDKLGKILGVICIGVCVLIFALGLFRGMEPLALFMVSVSLAVAAIPEGLTVVVTVILAMGMQKMVKINAIIKRLSAVETLGSTTVICSDKTGTLTQNKMTVLNIYDGKSFYDVEGTGYKPDGIIKDKNGAKVETNALDMMMKAAVLCNDALYKPEEASIIGDPTEGSLLVVANKYGFSAAEINSKFPRIDEIPFDSERKLMSTFHTIDNKTTMFTKGAPDEILRRSTFVFINGEIVPISESLKKEISTANENYAKNALRVLGFAFKHVDVIDKSTPEASECNLVFAGLVGMIDPPRVEVKDSIATCKKAGIAVKMITGDHKTTAAAIAGQIGIEPIGKAIDGREITAMNDEQLREAVKDTSVFARVSPEHKVRLVEAIKANGNIVSMTGDGVNDAPSLKRADIGVAMGITGTDVSKEAADMILTDDNFTTIVHAVEEGRTIYNNIRRVVGYLLSCNIGEILVIFVAMLINIPMPLAAIQLLTINLITDSFPAFALGMEAKEKGVMDEKPRDPNESILNKKMRVSVMFQSIALMIGTLTAYIIGLLMFSDFKFGMNAEEANLFMKSDGYIIASTMCFATLVIGELLRAFSARSETVSILKLKIFSNSFLNKCVLLSVAFLAVVVFVGPVQKIFNTTALDLTQFLIVVCFSVLPLIAAEISKKVIVKL